MQNSMKEHNLKLEETRYTVIYCSYELFLPKQHNKYIKEDHSVTVTNNICLVFIMYCYLRVDMPLPFLKLPVSTFDVESLLIGNFCLYKSVVVRRLEYLQN